MKTDNKTRHVFRQDVPSLKYMGLGDTSVRILAIHHLITKYRLDAIVVPPCDKELAALWTAVLGAGRVVSDAASIPDAFKDARISAPTSVDWRYGSAGWNVFESAMWENGFFDTRNVRLQAPMVFPCDRKSGAVMIYPIEGTDGNRVYDSEFWIETCSVFRRRGYRINHLGTRNHPNLRKFYDTVDFDLHFEPTIENLAACVSKSSLAIGSSTGPTWTLLFSDIEQLVLESKKSPRDYWFFDRCQHALAKKLRILPTMESLIPDL